MQREALESANTNTAVLTTMKNAADALKAAHKHMYVYSLSDLCGSYIELMVSVNLGTSTKYMIWWTILPSNKT